MYIQLCLFIALIFYSMLVSQAFMYIIALRNVQTSMDAATFIEFRKLLDANFRVSYKYVVYGSMLSSLVLLATCIFTAHNLLMAALPAFIALLADMFFMLKGNMPINNTINTWTADNHPYNWKDYRSRWLLFFLYRQIVTIGGFIILLAGTVFLL